MSHPHQHDPKDQPRKGLSPRLFFGPAENPADAHIRKMTLLLVIVMVAIILAMRCCA